MDEEIPQVRGLVLTERVVDGGSGEQWRARIAGGLAGPGGLRLPGELPGVGDCLVRLLRLPADEAVRARALVLAADLVGLDGPGLVRVRDARPAFDGVALIVDPPIPCDPLHLLARRRQLAAGEVVTLGVALGWALQAAHSAGLTHGRLRDADVLLDRDGCPHLAGVGVMGVLGSAGLPASDVVSLARLLGSVLDHRSTSATQVRAVLAASVEAGPEGLSAGEFAARLAQAAQAVPIRQGAPSPPEAPGPSGVRRIRLPRWSRRAGLATVGVAILVVSAAVGWMSAPVGAQPSSRRSVTKAVAGVDWKAVLGELDVTRAAVFEHPDPAALARVDVVDSAAYGYDKVAVEALVERKAHASGLRMTLDRVTVSARSGGRVTLSVTDRMLPYTVYDDVTNDEVASRPGRGPVTHLIVLRAAPAGLAGEGVQWRIERVS